MIRSYSPTKSTVNNVQFWEVEAINESDYKVLYSVSQVIEVIEVIEESIGESVEIIFL
ncbi:hypothetical protein [Enterococcus faecium]|uniref:hypothetical protein n=1 Tax=Enterococcus faecium TaxID=1352 RepID=UPI00287F9D65|nr:hypothetical protein [Enterococcus faecium]